ncbi:MAG TPA: CDP-diacylglycerol--serine O-phosphatidyltransferase [Myxococcaceae bacterium]|nr:CDP-diacylglycerol--serine O-phosphatidyltransferase [Myxococcaceae bacterium]
MKLRPLLFVLPNLFTVSSIFCGFYVVVLASGEADARTLHLAALITLFSNFCDTFDGRVARLTKTQSRFGMELDSLADVVAFGLAPAVLMYHWVLSSLGWLGLLVAFSFTACTALRLARFNVQASEDLGGGAFFTGIPAPMASAALAAIVIAYHRMSWGSQPSPELAPMMAAVTLLLAGLMVSTVRFRTFKQVGRGRTGVLLFGGALAVAVGIGLAAHPAYILITFCTAYIALGLIECVAYWAGRLRPGAEEELLEERGLVEASDEAESPR